MAASIHGLESLTVPTLPQEDDEGMAASGCGDETPSGYLKVIWGGNVPSQRTPEPCPSPPSGHFQPKASGLLPHLLPREMEPSP